MEEQATILLVDDHEELRQLVRQLLHDAGYETLEAADAGAMYAILQRQRVDLVLLDVMLPRIDGFAVCRELRGRHATLPIIMLTAKDEEFDRVLGLELGADDYITKPFSTREFVARIKAVLRRAPMVDVPIDEAPVAASGVRVDRVRHEVQVDGSLVDFPPKEFDLLAYLVENAGRVLTRGQLIDEIWGSDYVGDTKTLDVHIRRLRSRIEADAGVPARIQTVRGVGYRFADT